MPNTSTLTPFYEDGNNSVYSNSGSNSSGPFSLTRDDYFDLYVPKNITFWDGDGIGIIFFQEGQNYTTGKLNNIAIYNESKYVDIEKYKVNPTEKELEKNNKISPEVILEGVRNPQHILYRIFISDDADKLDFLANDKINGIPRGNEIQIFIEGDEDYLSSKKLYIRIGNDVKLDKLYLKDILKTYTTVDNETVEGLYKKLANGNSIEEEMVTTFAKKVTSFQLFLFKQGQEKINSITEYLSSLKIDFNEATFQDEDGNSTIEQIFSDLGSDLETVKEDLDDWDRNVLAKLKDTPFGLQLANILDMATNVLEGLFWILEKAAEYMLRGMFHLVSLFLGFINGVIDMLVGIVLLINIVGSGYLGLGMVVSGAVYILTEKEKQSFLEQADNFIDSFEGVKLSEVLSAAWVNLTAFIEDINFGAILEFFNNKNEGDKWYQNISSQEIFYYIGYGLTFFIPFTWVAKILGKLGPVGKLMNKAFNLFEDILKGIFNFVGGTVKFSFRLIVKLLAAIKNKIKGGINSIKKLIVEVFEHIRLWLDDVFPKWRKKLWKEGFDPDPTYRIWGKGELSHPKLWKKTIEDLISKGCEIKFGGNNLSYGPSSAKGKPGGLSLREESSITALLHEAKHFYDDLAKGFPTWDETVYNPNNRWEMERNAYTVEIEFLKKNKAPQEIIDELTTNMLDEKAAIEEFFNIKLK